LMICFSGFQFGVSDANMIESQGQAPLLDVSAQLTKVSSVLTRHIFNRVIHGR